MPKLKWHSNAQTQLSADQQLTLHKYQLHKEKHGTIFNKIWSTNSNQESVHFTTPCGFQELLHGRKAFSSKCAHCSSLPQENAVQSHCWQTRRQQVPSSYLHSSFTWYSQSLALPSLIKHNIYQVCTSGHKKHICKVSNKIT